MPRLLAPVFLFAASVTAVAPAARAQTTLELDPTVVAQKTQIGQGRVALPQLPHLLQARPSQTYRIKATVKASAAGARVRFGVMDEGWQCRFGADLPVTTNWAVYE